MTRRLLVVDVKIDATATLCSGCKQKSGDWCHLFGELGKDRLNRFERRHECVEAEQRALDLGREK